MAEHGGEFEDWHEDEPRSPLLPPEDRIWRHPSELSGAVLDGPEAQILAARRRWMASTPTRAGAGTAGIVGALLATGVVLIGTHLSAWLTRPAASASAQTNAMRTVIDVSTTTAPALRTNALDAAAEHVQQSLVQVTAVHGRTTTTGDGAVLSSNGYVVVPAAVVAGATTISVVLGGGEELIARLSGADPTTGLAILHVAATGLHALPVSPVRSLPVDSLVLVAWRQGRFNMEVAPVAAAPVPASLSAGPALLETYPASLGIARAPIGTLLIDAKGAISGMVVLDRHHRAVAAPGWVIGRITSYLISYGKVEHGWLGIVGRVGSAPVTKLESKTFASRRPSLVRLSGREATGVEVVTVVHGSAAARAGLRSGDLIESVDGQPVTSMSGLQAMLYLMAPATSVRIEIVRGGRQTELRARLARAA